MSWSQNHTWGTGGRMKRMYKKIVGWSLFFFLATFGSLHAQETSPEEIQSAELLCRAFTIGTSASTL